MPFVVQLLILCSMAVISNIKVAVQGKCGRETVTDTMGRVAYNGLMFGFTALIFFVVFFEPRLPSPTTWLLAAIYAVSSVLYQWTYLGAMQCGPISLTVLVNSFSVIPKALLGVVAYGEELTALKVIGLVVILISFFFAVRSGTDEKPVSGRWLVMALSAALGNTVLTAMQKIHQETPVAGERSLFVVYGYVIAGVVSLIVVAFARLRKKPVGLKLSPKVCWLTALAAAALGGYQLLNMWMVGEMDSMVMQPISTSISILVSFLFGAVLFKDRLSRRQWIGAGIGIVGVVLLGI